MVVVVAIVRIVVAIVVVASFQQFLIEIDLKLFIHSLLVARFVTTDREKEREIWMGIAGAMAANGQLNSSFCTPLTDPIRPICA